MYICVSMLGKERKPYKRQYSLKIYRNSINVEHTENNAHKGADEASLNDKVLRTQSLDNKKTKYKFKRSLSLSQSEGNFHVTTFGDLDSNKSHSSSIVSNESLSPKGMVTSRYLTHALSKEISHQLRENGPMSVKEVGNPPMCHDYEKQKVIILKLRLETISKRKMTEVVDTFLSSNFDVYGKLDRSDKNKILPLSFTIFSRDTVGECKLLDRMGFWLNYKNVNMQNSKNVVHMLTSNLESLFIIVAGIKKEAIMHAQSIPTRDFLKIHYQKIDNHLVAVIKSTCCLYFSTNITCIWVLENLINTTVDHHDQIEIDTSKSSYELISSLKYSKFMALVCLEKKVYESLMKKYDINIVMKSINAFVDEFDTTSIVLDNMEDYFYSLSHCINKTYNVYEV